MRQNTLPYPQPTTDEQPVLEQLSVRPIHPHEVERFDQLLVQHHSLKNGCVVGEHLRYIATYQGQWLGLATWSAAALQLKARDAFIGWTPEQRRKRLRLIANNCRSRPTRKNGCKPWPRS